MDKEEKRRFVSFHFSQKVMSCHVHVKRFFCAGCCCTCHKKCIDMHYFISCAESEVSVKGPSTETVTRKMQTKMDIHTQRETAMGDRWRQTVQAGRLSKVSPVWPVTWLRWKDKDAVCSLICFLILSYCGPRGNQFQTDCGIWHTTHPHSLQNTGVGICLEEWALLSEMMKGGACNILHMEIKGHTLNADSGLCSQLISLICCMSQGGLWRCTIFIFIYHYHDILMWMVCPLVTKHYNCHSVLDTTLVLHRKKEKTVISYELIFIEDTAPHESKKHIPSFNFEIENTVM